MVVAHSSSLAVGSQVGPYRIIGELGGGGMGMVYRAVHVLLQRSAAIKVLRPELTSCASARARFLAEACAMAAIRHPGIVEVYDYGHTGTGSAYIAMELLEGQTLGARLAERGRLGLLETMVLARRIAAPLAVAHQRGVVHRDLKPENVFLVRDHDGGSFDQVKLLDFGIAKLESAAAAELSAVELVLGTPPYMSPEQCRGASACDHRTDLYALGCILFELLTGQPPYGSGLTSDELAVAQRRLPVPDVGQHLALPPEIARLIRRMLARRAEDRPRHALEVVAEVDRWLTTQGVARSAGRGGHWLASQVARFRSSLAALGARYRGWRSGMTAAPRDRFDTSGPTLIDPQLATAAGADTASTRTPTQPMVALAPGPSPVPTLVAGPRCRRPAADQVAQELDAARAAGEPPSGELEHN